LQRLGRMATSTSSLPTQVATTMSSRGKLTNRPRVTYQADPYM
jgi:hypothetical protein